MKYFLPFCFLFTIWLLASCGSILPKTPDLLENPSRELPATSGSLKIPLEVNLTPYLDLANKSLDKEFKGEQSQCEGVSFAYQFKRDPLKFSGKEQTLTTTINGLYSIKANYCAQCSELFGMDEFCITPRLYVSCGIGEPMRKIEVKFQSNLSITNDYKIKSATKLVGLESKDPCQFTFLKYDASKLIEKEMTTFLRSAEKMIDKEVNKVNVRKTISDVWTLLQQPMPIESYGYLYFRPKEVGFDEFHFEGNKAFASIEMALSPLFSTDLLSLPPTSLPDLKDIGAKDQFALPVVTILSYDSINSILAQEMQHQKLVLKKKTIYLDTTRILGPVGEKLLMKIDFSGDKRGTLYLLGTPTYDSLTELIQFPDLDFDLETRHVLLKSAKWLYSDKITEILREKAQFNIGTQLKNSRQDIEKSINRKLSVGSGNSAKLSGQIKNIRMVEIAAKAQTLNLVFELVGNLRIDL